LRYGKCGDDFMVLPGARRQSPMKSAFSCQILNEQRGFILSKHCASEGVLSAIQVAERKKHRPSAFCVALTSSRESIQANCQTLLNWRKYRLRAWHAFAGSPAAKLAKQ
jgi:hypothetical protein